MFGNNRLGKNLIPDQFSFQAVKERRRKKKNQREEHWGRERKRKEIGQVTISLRGREKLQDSNSGNAKQVSLSSHVFF